jgi:hypothetical protein
MRGLQLLAVIAGLCLTTPLAAGKATPHTPSVGSSERTVILTALRTHPDMRFTLRHLRVWNDGGRAIAFAEGDNGVIGGFKIILTRDGDAGWSMIWGEGDGGSNSCIAGARHYRWAIDLIASYHTAPDALFPGVTAQTRELERMAKEDPDSDCVGDLEGGPK